MSNYFYQQRNRIIIVLLLINYQVIGESKINVEKDTIVNDGKQRFETYQLVLTKKNSQGN